MINREILRSIASITNRVGDLASPNIDKIFTNKSMTVSGEVIVADTMDSYSGDVTIEGKTKQNTTPPTSIHSLGENGKIYLKSSNRNLFPVSHNFKEGDLSPVFPADTKVDYKNGNVIVTKLTSDTSRHVIFNHKVYLKKDTKYYVVAEMLSSDNTNTAIAIRNSEGGFVYNSNVDTVSVKRLEFTCAKSDYYNLAFSTTDLGLNSTITLKFCYFSTHPMGDGFLQHQENIVEIPLGQPLRSIDTISLFDKIIRKGGKYYVERRIGKLDVNESNVNNWTAHTMDSDNRTIGFKTSLLCDLSMKGVETSRVYCVSSLLTGVSHDNLYQETPNADVGVSISQSATTYLRVMKSSILPSDTLEGFREYVKTNPFYILYPLKEPVYEELKIDDLQVELYPEVSVIYTYDEYVYGKTTIEIPMNISSIISNDVRKINSLEKEIENAERTVLAETMNIINIDEQFNNHIHQI